MSVSPSNKKKQVTRRQHWLPKASYLNNFAEDGKVLTYWLKDKDKTNFMITAEKKRIAPINLGVKKDLYETPNTPDNLTEDALATIEAEYGKVLKNKILKRKPLDEEELNTVAYYASTLESRTPSSFAGFESGLDELEDKLRKMSIIYTGSEDAAREQIEGVRQAKAELPATVVATAADVNKWNLLDLCFLIIPDNVTSRFITSDHPVTMYDFTCSNGPYGIPIGSKTAEFVVPLSPTIALFGNSCGITDYREVDYNFVSEINQRVLTRSEKILISKNELGAREGKSILLHRPQSLLLKFLDLPDGRMDDLAAKATESD